LSNLDALMTVTLYKALVAGQGPLALQWSSTLSFTGMCVFVILCGEGLCVVLMLVGTEAGLISECLTELFYHPGNTGVHPILG
jgi:hypothetical protein